MPNPTEQIDVVAEARAILANHHEGRVFVLTVPQYDSLPELLKTLSAEVEQRTRALKLMVELWDAEHPDDPCGCVGASDDCRYPPTCELCVARLTLAGRINEDREADSHG